MKRRAIAVSGIVQGVGFRPFVYGLAARLGLHGFVKNQTGGVLIEVEGEDNSLDQFLDELSARPPRLAQIENIHWEWCRPRGDHEFRIESSTSDTTEPIFPAPDIATCDDCLAELFDPRDRRYRYPFLNCTNCGPRLTIIRGTPYDRERTTMASYVMCAECRAEYEDPANRRFHAQPIACPRCGPQLKLWDAHGNPLSAPDPLGEAVRALREGKIVALKGLGGYHLACDASNSKAVAELRIRKHRDEKPFALMVRDVTAARGLADISAAEEDLISSPARPIVVLGRRSGADTLSGSAGNPGLGIMLPYTPLHHLLFEALDSLPLVMTSGNRSDEPIAYDDRDAGQRLDGIADLFLTHDRPIESRCDDSVTRVVAGIELPVRRSRGYAPAPIRLPVACSRPTLAVGGQLKVTFALGRERHAVLSHHIGDLDDYEAYRAYVGAIAHYERLFATRPDVLVHDLHPDYASTRYARERADAGSALHLLLPVQHHHAHVASCMAEHGLVGQVIGVALDGTGYGSDGAVWGGEFLMADYREFRRAAHLRYVAMPGGEQAIREPWRMAAAHLSDAGLDTGSLQDQVSPAALATALCRQIERRFNAPLTSSMGRLFDAVAALVGVRRSVRYEGQAAIELEGLAAGLPLDGAYPFELGPGSPLIIDTRPLIVEVAAELHRGRPACLIGRRFHSTVVEIVAQVCARISAGSGLATVALSGGVFLNALLTHEVGARLERDGFRVYRHRRVPPSDGGLSLGQLAVAAVRQSDGP